MFLSYIPFLRTFAGNVLGCPRSQETCHLQSWLRLKSPLPRWHPRVADNLPFVAGRSPQLFATWPCVEVENKGRKKSVCHSKNRGFHLEHFIWRCLLDYWMYGCESWTVKKAECRRIDAIELWCWRRLLRVPWTARSSNQSILSFQYPLEGLMLKLKLQYFGNLMRRTDSLEKTLMLG